MMLSENDLIISDETTIADTMNKYFVKITKKLKLKPTEIETNELTMSVILDKSKDHQSIVRIRSRMNGRKNSFSFKPVTSEEELKTIYSLKTNKGCEQGCIQLFHQWTIQLLSSYLNVLLGLTKK